jgi:hypothetical protein
MNFEDWNKDEIKRLAVESGKPLEVRCAEVFLKANWNVRLGTYYEDSVSGKLCELDFLAEKEVKVAGKSDELLIRSRILGSCKGFVVDTGPGSYSISFERTAISYQKSGRYPHFLYFGCGAYWDIAGPAITRSARDVRNWASAGESQQIIGFDIFTRQTKDKNKPEYGRKTDRDLYEGLNSAIKGALFWNQHDRYRLSSGLKGGAGCFNVPLLITSRPFWNVSIDEGNAGEPTTTGKGFHVSLLPLQKGQPPEPIIGIVWYVENIEELVRRLDHLLEGIQYEVQHYIRD